MQEKAVLVFKTASILFGFVGILFVIIGPEESGGGEFFGRTLSGLGFVILASFAIAVAEKYLQNGKK
ncbi:MAG: hypothetical protein R3313_00375 [Candidatus Saccharimonadales bacterium]|nr:hypothetical protein [Candidatus Saccharimonadales bacterium]